MHSFSVVSKNITIIHILHKPTGRFPELIVSSRQYGSNFNYVDVIPPEAAEFSIITQNNGRALRRSRSFKVIDFGTNQKPVCNFLLLNNTNLYPFRSYCRLLIKFLCRRELPLLNAIVRDKTLKLLKTKLTTTKFCTRNIALAYCMV